MLVDDRECPPLAPYPVQRWRENALAIYLSEHKIRDSEVKAITWWKDTDRSEHEYIIVECHRPRRKEVFHLRIERQPANYQPSLHDAQAEERDPCKRSFWTFLQKLRPKVVAMDLVSQVPESFTEEARKIARYDFKETKLFVRDLAFLSCIVHTYRPKYEVFVYQCYWYCQTIINVLGEVYQPVVTEGAHFQEKGTYRIKRRWFRSGPLTVNKPCESEVDRIRREFAAALEFHDEEVRWKGNEPSGRQELGRRVRDPRR